MTESQLRRHTGIFGLVATLISLTEIPLYFTYNGAPPQWDILTRVLVGVVGSTILIVFLAGYRLVICRGRPQLEWASYRRSRLRAHVADVQHGGPIHGGWNGHCVKNSNRPDCRWRPRPGSIPPVGSHRSAHDDPLPVGLGVRDIAGSVHACVACLVGFPHRFNQRRICPSHVLRLRRGSVLQCRRVGFSAATAPVLVLLWIIIASIIMVRTPAKSET